MSGKNIAGAGVGLAFVILGLLGAANGKVPPSVAMVIVGLMFIGWHGRRLLESRRALAAHDK
ncbi:hypothetical protein [Cellulomonas soli]|uniref:Uncharacterized protein n=1 Tax=Cellulomonas soli TaxID=931535 RepID=A0A512PHJ1_9CELL|nr:hypothetical protein [Cellulomonas soli]NYI59154.1 hypothetical protein [Cellulomonas soli]GEP70657.1 hypothetical protein CSO01_33720 [Cellulomonas soli]